MIPDMPSRSKPYSKKIHVDPEGRTFGDRIRTMREERGWSLTDLCQRSGVSPQTISTYEKNNTKEPGFYVAMKLAEAFDVDPSVLAGTPRRGTKRSAASAETAVSALIVDRPLEALRAELLAAQRAELEALATALRTEIGRNAASTEKALTAIRKALASPKNLHAAR